MASLKKMMREKVQASSLLEVIIAMVVIMVVFGIAMMIFTNVTGSSLSSKRIRAEQLVNDALIRAETHAESPEAYEQDGFKIAVNTELAQQQEMIKVTATATDENGKVVAEAKRLMPAKDE